MTTFRSENVLVGLIAAALLPWIGWTVVRGLRNGRLPIGRAYVSREERPAPFHVLLAFYVGAAALMIAISLDLLFGVRISS